MRQYRCRACGMRDDRWASLCHGCLRWGTLGLVGETRSEAPTSTKIVPTLDEVQTLDGKRIDTGIAGLNRVFGTNREDSRQGLAIPSSTIFTGDEGSGKSTIVLKMLAMTKERNSLFLSTEQMLSEIKATVVGIGLGHLSSRIQAYSLLDDGCSIDVAFEKIMALNPRLLAVDSVTKMRESGRAIRNGLQSKVRIVERFKRDAEINNRATIMISHMTKDKKIAGAQESLYDVSTVLMLEKRDRSLRRLYIGGKNRFGDPGEEAFFEMSRTGLQEVSADEELAQVNKTRAEWGLKPQDKL